MVVAILINTFTTPIAVHIRSASAFFALIAMAVAIVINALGALITMNVMTINALSALIAVGVITIGTLAAPIAMIEPLPSAYPALIAVIEIFIGA